MVILQLLSNQVKAFWEFMVLVEVSRGKVVNPLGVGFNVPCIIRKIG